MKGFNKKFVWLCALLPLLITSNAFADSFVSLFQPAEQDLSLTFLAQLFGTVSGILVGTGSQVLGMMFGVMNKGIVALMGVVFTYAIYRFVIDTANDGEMMGKGKSFALTTIRTVLGLSLAIPSATTGYCLAQSVVMWATIQGVGLADNTWNRVLDYLQNEGGQLYVVAQDTQSYSKLVNPTTTILRSEVCMYMLKAINDRNNNSSANNSNPLDITSPGTANNKAMPSLAVKAPSGNAIKMGYAINQDNTMTFGSLNPNYDPSVTNSHQYNDECGKISWAATALNKDKIGDSSISYVEAGINQMVLDLSPTAKNIANSTNPGANNPFHSIETPLLNNILNAIVSYTSVTRPVLAAQESNAKEDLAEKFDKSRAQGWMTAGSYYRTIANVNTKLSADISSIIPETTSYSQDGKGPAFAQLTSAQLQEFKTTLAQVQFNQNELDKALANYGKGVDKKGYQRQKDGENFGIQTWRLGMLGYALAGAGAVMTLGAGLSAGPHAAAASAITTASMLSLLVTWGETINKPGDPIAHLQLFGQVMVGIATVMWLAITGALFWLTILPSAGSSASGVANAINVSTKWFTSILFAVMTAMFVNGLVLSVYVPLIPYIIFTFASIGWLIGVLEAMVAAPLIALGISHPEGHDLLGKAEQAMMLILSVFLRPVLLLIGLIAALLLARISVSIINAGFDTVISETNITLAGINIFGTMALMIIYTLMQVYAIQLSCGLITGLKDKALAVLGFHPERESHDQILHSAQGGVQGTAQTMGQAGWQSTQAATKNMQKTKKGMSGGAGSGNT